MKINWDGKSKNIIGSKMKQFRKMKKMNQRQLAESLQCRGLDFSSLTVLRIEKGDRFVADFELAIIADFFGITADELLGVIKE